MKSLTKNLILILILFLVLFGCKKPKINFDFKLIKIGNIVTDSGFSQGAAWTDYNNDGYDDLFVTNSWTNGNNLFYVNNGDGTFTANTREIIANDGGNSNGCTWGDVDNDGDADLFVANVNNQNNFMYLNNSDGSFKKIITASAVNDAGWSYTATWGDYNNDGWLDLFVGNYKDQSNLLYTNDGMGNLYRTNNSLIEKERKSSQGSAWFDFDNDGDLDLYVCNSTENSFYENLGNGSFQLLNNIEPVKHKANSFGCSVADYDNDGFLDIFVANWWGKNNLYRNLGDKTFEKVSGSPVTEESLNSEGSSWGDFDNDGDLDLFVTNDGNNSFFENRSFKFVKREDLCVANDSSNSNGVTWNDFDNDGDLDIFIANGGNQPNLLYTNPGDNNNWIKVKCIGSKSNRSAIGTRITLYQQNHKQIREISAQSGGGYGAQNGLVAHFGLGETTKIDSLCIDWPSGKQTTILKLHVNQILTLTE